MQGNFSAKDLRRTVRFIVMREWAAPFHRVFHVREARRRIVVLVVAAADAERDAMTLRHDDAGRPDLDVELHRLPRLERLLLVVRMPRPIGQAFLRIELAMRCTQPALPDRCLRVERAVEEHFLSGRIEHPEYDEETACAS